MNQFYFGSRFGQTWICGKTGKNFVPNVYLLDIEFQEKIAFDGLWIDMNEPANFVAGDMNDGCAGTLYETHLRNSKRNMHSSLSNL